VLYPLEKAVTDGWLLAAFALIALSILSIWAARQRPYILVGWFWYVGTLVPVIGLIQVGRQSSADRYTYVPLIGLFLIVVFGLNDALASLRVRRLALATAGGLAIAACMWVTRVQLAYWNSGRTLWEHTMNVTGESAFAHLTLGIAYAIEGRLDLAMQHYFAALRLEPKYAEAHNNLANALSKIGKADEAIVHYSEAVRLASGVKKSIVGDKLAGVHFNWGLALAYKGDGDEATRQFAEALRIRPNYPEVHIALGNHYLIQGKPDQAIVHFSEAIRLNPNDVLAHNNLGSALGAQGRIEEAISEYTEAVRLDARYVEARTNLGILLATKGKNDDAIAHFTEALRLSPGNPTAQTWLTNLTSKNAAKP
jgi:tetratricopeptide (TPR) repeat protein